MSTYSESQPIEVIVENGFAMGQEIRFTGEKPPFWYVLRGRKYGKWKDWVDLARAIIEAEETRKAS